MPHRNDVAFLLLHDDGAGLMNKRGDLWIVMVILTFTLSILAPVQAQDIPSISPDLCTALPADGAPEACTALAQCIDERIDSVYVCELKQYQPMLQLCAQPQCEDDVLLSLSIMLVVAEHQLEGAEPVAFQRTLETVLYFYREQDANAAAAALRQLYAEYSHRLLPYAAGLIYENAGYFDEALAEYARTIETEFFTPFVFYSRGYLRAEIGDAVGATQDFYTFSVMQAEESYYDLTPLTVPQMEIRDLMLGSERWMLYPVSTYSFNPGGESASYLFGEPARPIEIMWSEETDNLTILDFDPLVFDVSVPQALFFDCEDDVCRRSLAFQQTFPGLNAGGTFLTASFNGEYAEVEQVVWGSEGQSEMYWVMLPQGADDPRPEIPCENGVYPLLQQGDEVFPDPWWWTVTVHASPDPESDVLAEVGDDQSMTLQISGELTCGPGGNWWPVTVDGNIAGWVLDGRDGRYSLVTADWQPRRTVAELLALP